MRKYYQLAAEPQVDQYSRKLESVNFIASDGPSRHLHNYQVSERLPIDGLIVILALGANGADEIELGIRWNKELKLGKKINMGWYDAKFLVDAVGFKPKKTKCRERT
ncbi:hypothetical protein [Terracidiphilus gabretensis]|uniref:hypothetical protein n=1 Tax=Terracidiphilus gabretensis TaxID=1577687 RepID=UPI00071BB317|nr:hypothetical protein [Terracidiphilus gabretensis]